MNDKTDGDDDRSGWKPREAKPAAGGEKRVFKPRPLGAAPARPTAGAPRKSYPKSFDTEAPRTPRGGEKSVETRGPRPASSDRRPERDEVRPLGPVRAAPREDAASEANGTMRIAKRLARAGIASRRDAEGMIADGRVRLNGKVLDTPAVTVTARDRIEIDNTPLPQTERTRLWLFHKPAGLVTTNRDPEGRPTVFDRLPADLPRVLSVGRLDINTEGLLLLTNDGGLARILELPATGWLRRYRVRAHGAITQGQLDELRQGIAIDGVFYGAIEASLDSEKGANVWLTLGLREGKNREVKRILGHLGLDVNRLIRLSFGPFQLGDLPEGAVREIKGRMLRDQLGERLIEESGADFDAPIVNTFTNETVKAEKKDEAPKPKSEWVSATMERPNKRRFGDAKRTEALGRLDTKPDRGDRKPGRGDRPERPARDAPRPPRGEDRPRGDDRSRSAKDAEAPEAPKKPGGPRRMANVWMAPGARPLGEKKAAAREDRAQGRDRPKPVFGKTRAKSEDEGRPKRASAPARVGDRSSLRPAGDAPRGKPRPARDGAPRGSADGPKRGPKA